MFAPTTSKKHLLIKELFSQRSWRNVMLAAFVCRGTNIVDKTTPLFVRRHCEAVGG